MYKEINCLKDYASAFTINEAVLFYFSHEECNVCKALKPKIEQLIQDEFPFLKLFYIDTKQYPDIAAQNSVFTNPVILIYFQGKEFYRKGRNISIVELSEILSKPYNIIFS